MKTISFCVAFILLLSVCAAQEPNDQPVEKSKEPTAFEKTKAFHESELWVTREAPKPPEPAPFIGIGLEPVKPEDVEKTGGPKDCAGIKITNVVPDSGAEKAKLKEGDIIFATQKDGEQTLFTPTGEDYSPLSELAPLLKDKKPGDKIAFCILRDGKMETKTVTLGARPVFNMTEAKHPELAPESKTPSRLAKFLADNKLLEKYVETAEMLYAASNIIQGPVRVVEDKPDFFRLEQVTYLLRHPENTSTVSEQIADSIEETFNAKQHDLRSLIQNASRWIDVEYAVKEKTVELKGDGEDIDRIVKHVEEAIAAREKSLGALSDSDRKALMNLPGTLSMENQEEVLASLKAAAKVDYPQLLRACAAFAGIADRLDEIKKCAESLGDKSVENVEGVTGWVLFAAETKAGKIIIGGKGPNVYTADAAVIIDLGGDDVYKNNAGGSTPSHPFSLCIDFAGNDIYTSENPFAQGAGFTGAGILIDVEGNDTYRGSAFSQGCGMLGVGILADFAGDDTYRAKEASQGIGSFGIGVIAEGGGEDSYRADNFAQGLGLAKGFGAIVEVSGNDSYYIGGKNPDFRDPKRSNVSFGQGFAIGSRPGEENPTGTSGGIGLLADAAGHDHYVGDYFCQGSSYWFALGILRDREGSDHYYCGRYSQGAGIHLSLGALIDCNGDDSYIAYFGVSQGCGHDWSYGILEDKAGNDYYQAGYLAQGAGNDSGIGVLVDHSGNDRYVGEGETQGMGVNLSRTRQAGSVGVFMDLDGDDKYLCPKASENNTQKKREETNIGLFFDTSKKQPE
ncbi:MAG: PDZ domain-containing protein [Planctomycetota bacterium]